MYPEDPSGAGRWEETRKLTDAHNHNPFTLGEAGAIRRLVIFEPQWRLASKATQSRGIHDHGGSCIEIREI